MRLRLPVYTYFVPVPELWEANTQLRLLELWQENWSAAGWQPVILDETHAARQAGYADYLFRVSQLPTVYPVAFVNACYLRWLAMAEVGGGLLVDYDVFNYGMPVRQPASNEMTVICNPQSPEESRGGKWISLGAVLAPGPLFAKMSRYFAEWVPTEKDRQEHGSLHCDDNEIINRMVMTRDTRRPDWLHSCPGCVRFSYPGWDTSLLTHFAFEMKAAGYWPKCDWVKKLRDWTKQ